MPNQSDIIQRTHSTRQFPKLNKSILKFILLIVIFAIATPALADYFGPDRVVTETVGVCKVVLYQCRYVPAKDDWRYTRAEDWSCSNASEPWQAFPDQPSSQGCFDATAGDKYWGREDTSEIVTTTFPPATISSSLQNCSLQNGWCGTSPQLSLSGSEPVSGYSINLIEGTLNGQTFACSGANCSVPLNEGNNSFTYWALSTWGDSSTMGNFTAKVDTQLPNITGAFTGTLGSYGWYITPVSFTGNASDATSGLASFTCTRDGVALGSCNSININSEGPHTIVLTARDNAGRTNTLNQNASLDTQNPVLNAALSGTLGANTWYTAAMLHASASDPMPGSGLAGLNYNLDNSNWITFPVSGVLNLPDGKHSLDVRAVDTAGRTVSSSKSFWLDSIAPNVMLNPTGTLGLNDWYTTSLNLTASASDATSGMDIFEYSLNSSAWTTYTSLSLPDGTHGLSFWGQDQAGLVTQVDLTYKVDTHAPQIGGSLSGVPGANGWYISDVTLSASASDPMPGSDMEAFTYILNGGAETSYSDALTLSDGQHTFRLDAVDKAGWTHSTEQIIKVDTIYPSLNIQTALPNWIKDSVTLNGSAGDNGSGLLKVEISTDGGQIWQPVIGTTSWGYTWNTQNSSNGIHDVQVRAIDNAGLTTKRSFNTGVDNRAPKISVPASWYQWDTVILDIWDDDSGLSEARVEISDPEGRWPTRIIRLNPGRFPLDFKWDRRFADDTIAPLGTYNVKVVAFDNLGNPTRTSASINILLGILPAGPTATPQPSSRPADASTPTANQTVTPTANPISSHMETQPAVVSIFGLVEATSQAMPTPKTSPIPRATPPQTSVLDWLQSIFIPSSDAAESVTEVAASVSLSASRSSNSGSTSSKSPVLWGAAAAGVIGAATAYVLEEKRKRKEEEARQAAQVKAEVEAKNVAIQASQQAERDAMKIQNWLEGQAILNAQIEEAKKQSANNRTEYKEAQLEQETKAHAAKPQQWETAYTAYIAQNAMQDWHSGEKEIYIAPPKEKTWWDNTKSFVMEEIIQPLNTYFLQPYVKPAVEKAKHAVTNTISWANENIYQPSVKPALEKTKQLVIHESAWINENIYQSYIQPLVERTKQFVINETASINENIYQPYIKPLLDKTIEVVTNGTSWVNKNVYQPYVQPVLTAVNEKIYQSYVKPLLDKIKEVVANDASWINKNIYQPYIEPVVSDIDQYIYQPYFKPSVDRASTWWEKYGEWVHGALDAVGLIPGLGEIADGLNGLIYLGEGRYLEASLSAMSMIPILGDLGKAGKWGLNLGQEVLEEATEKVVKEVAEEVIEKEWMHVALDAAGGIPGARKVTDGINSLIYLGKGRYLEAGVSAMSIVPVVGDLAKIGLKIGKEILGKTAEKVVKEGVEELAQKAAKETLEEAAEKTLKEAGEELVNKVAKELSEEASEKIFKETGEGLVENVSQTVAQKMTKEATDEVATMVIKDTVAVTPVIPTEKVLKTVAEETIEETLEQVSEETTQRVLKEVVEGKVTKLPVDLVERLTDEGAAELAEKISKELGGKKVWVSAKSGSMYVSSPPAEGFILAEQLSKIDLTKTDEVEKILKRIAELTSRGSGNHVVLGPFRPNGTFIQEALDTNGVFWDVGDELWEALEKTGLDMFKANDQFLRLHVSNGIDRFDVVHTNVNKVINDFNISAPKDWTRTKYIEKEILDLASMPDIPYQLIENSWIRVNLINNTD